ncbi:MAG: phosphoribosylformylglycinamidine cyclo-ligase [Deferribacteraceae bacterium]|jgi:phosphoribosylformylglycinamidine cyclo-ligase|nr:phosphoribosylformylglycinamidine cyclo-ligase [Deferribacteraceae bacterium]
MSENAYKESGVNIDEGNRFVALIKNIAGSTHNKSVIHGIGGFAGLYALDKFRGMKDPVLVSSADGVGTKLKVAIEANVYNTVGIDLVAMSLNDIVVTGARPLIFLDYIATGSLSADKMALVLEGIAAGCREAETALLGGETAEMPGMYADGDFDLAGFAVGIVERDKIIDGSGIKEGDCLVGLASSGFHSNGYSLLRKVFFKDSGFGPDDCIKGYGKVSEMLLTPTRIYVKAVMAALAAEIPVKGMVHITGGGFYDNIPRVLPDGTAVVLDKRAFPKIPAFDALRSVSSIPERELHRVFNMGIGFIFILSQSDTEPLLKVAAEMGETAHVIGTVVRGGKNVSIRGIDV